MKFLFWLDMIKVRSEIEDCQKLIISSGSSLSLIESSFSSLPSLALVGVGI